MRFKNGALGTLEASRFAWGRKNYLTFEISGSKGALAFSWERRNELHYYAAADRDDVQGYRTSCAGRRSRAARLFWPIPGLGTAFYETQVLQTGDFHPGDRQGRAAGHGFRARPARPGDHGDDACRRQERHLAAGLRSAGKA